MGGSTSSTRASVIGSLIPIVCLTLAGSHVLARPVQTGDTLWVRASHLNVRQLPSTDAKILAQLPYAAMVTVRPISDSLDSQATSDWIYCSADHPRITGWVYSNYLGTTDPLAAARLRWNKVYSWLDEAVLTEDWFLDWWLEHTVVGPELHVVVSSEWEYWDRYRKETHLEAIGHHFEDAVIDNRVCKGTVDDKPMMLFVDSNGKKQGYWSPFTIIIYRPREIIKYGGEWHD